MSVGFGFSVGDFIAALELVATVVDALRESGEASKQYRGLVRQLDSLESVLLRVKRLELDESQHAEHVALQQAAAQCQRTIEDFWKKIKTYQPALSFKGTASRLKEGWMKIRWAVCKKEDINTFKADIAAHTDSIQLLLTTIQMSHAKLHEKRNENRNMSLAGKIQAAYFECMKKISAIFEITATGIEQGKQLISTSSKILETNVKIFQVVLNIQNFITHIPAQVERQQPVYLIDAFGRHSPFHLEFIRSAEALTAVLQANFSKNGQARMKIGRGEFVIQNSLTKRDINIFGDWDKCFYPGQRVEMSVVFQRRWQTGSSCPGCGVLCDGSTETEVECPKCEMTFRRIIEIEQERSTSISSHQTFRKHVFRDAPPAAKRDRSISMLQTTSKIYPSSSQQRNVRRTISKLKRKREYARDDDLELDLHLENIRRVRITTVARGITEKFKALFGYFEEGGTPEPAFCCGLRTKDDESCLIIEFEDNHSSALCDTIGPQAFKLGGLFHTDLVAAESINEDAEETSTQITWMEEDEVQMYLRFESISDRNVIWAFILFAQAVWKMRAGQPLLAPSVQTHAAKATSPESDMEDSLIKYPDSAKGKEDASFLDAHFQNIDDIVLASPSNNGQAFQLAPSEVDNLDSGYIESLLPPYEGLQESVFGQEPFEGAWQPLFPQNQALPATALGHSQLDDESYALFNDTPTPHEKFADDELCSDAESRHFADYNTFSAQDQKETDRYQWPTEKELDRHHNDTHVTAPLLYECLFKPCPYRSTRKSNCKQHMEKAHGWEYVRSKSDGKIREKVHPSSSLLDSQTINMPIPSSDANVAHTAEEYDSNIQTSYTGSVIDELPSYSDPLSSTIAENPNDTVEVRRARNTLAARRSRQRKRKQFSTLEEQIAKLERERDHWKAVSSSNQQGISDNAPHKAIALPVADVDMKLVIPDEEPFTLKENNTHTSHDHKMLD